MIAMYVLRRVVVVRELDKIILMMLKAAGGKLTSRYCLGIVAMNPETWLEFMFLLSLCRII
jgi:hypothetical protein